MPETSRPSPSGVTLAVEVPDYHSLSDLFNRAGIPTITCAEARELAEVRIPTWSDDTARAIELAVQDAVAHVLRARLVMAKLIAGGVGEVFVRDLRNRGYVLVGEFAPVEQAVGRAA
jgi:hypothetical protein